MALVISPYLGTLEGSTAGVPVGNPTTLGPVIPEYERDLIAGALAHGYTVAEVTLRDFGASGGCNDWGGAGERADAKAAVEWAAAAS